MRYFLTSILIFVSTLAFAQEPENEILTHVDSISLGIIPPDGYEWVDTVVVVRSKRFNEELVGRDIRDLLPSKNDGAKATVKVEHSAKIDSALTAYLNTNQHRKIKGYRIRLFFSNKQSARAMSEEIIADFSKRHPLVPAYLGYQYPYFKVTVGDFRTKSEARAFLKDVILKDYPTAFLVPEDIEYPTLGDLPAMQYDTVRILRPIIPEETPITEENGN